jgi:hypothetical protein
VETTILKDWITNEGYRAVVLRLKMGHNCGYVGITESHPLFGKTYSQHCDCLIPLRDKAFKGPIGKRGIIPIFCSDGETASMDIVFDVHGSVTYTEQGLAHREEFKFRWWIGFDCMHAGDTPENCDLDFCIKECENLSKQIAEVKDVE